MLVPLEEYRRDSLSVNDCSLTASTLDDLGDDDDLSDSVVTVCDEYPESLLEVLSLEERLSRSPLLFVFILELCFVPRTDLSSSSHSSK